eukprot:364411-Chlamydomonas_euryale.AAC.4
MWLRAACSDVARLPASRCCRRRGRGGCSTAAGLSPADCAQHRAARRGAARRSAKGGACVRASVSRGTDPTAFQLSTLEA